jgi:uncharacterized coiled-coil DUF342 family protein
LINSSWDQSGALCPEPQDHEDSGMLTLESSGKYSDSNINSADLEPLTGALDLPELAQPIKLPIEIAPEQTSIINPADQPQLMSPQVISTISNDPHNDVAAELDSLLLSLQLTTPRPPQLELTSAANSIESIHPKIAVGESVTHTQELLQALSTNYQQLTTARTELQLLHHRNQVQVDRVDASTEKVKRLKSQTQQLSQESNDRVELVRQLLDSIDRIHTEIVTNLDKFGGYEEIHSMLTQLSTTRQALELAHDRVTTGQTDFYESLQVIQQQVTSQSQDSEQKLREYQSSIQSLAQTIAADQLRITEMSLDLGTKINNLAGLNDEITTMHSQVVEKSQTLQVKIAEIDRGFGSLSQSLRAEQQQFYELTAETIDKADVIQSQLTDVIKQISNDRASITALKSSIESIKQACQQVILQQSNEANSRYQELLTICTDLQFRQQERMTVTNRQSRWLWILSIAVGIIFILSIRR